jgi:hypothetical protein
MTALAQVLTVLCLPASFVLFLIRPRLWLPVYILTLAAAPQVSFGSVPISACNMVLIAAGAAIALLKIYHRDSSMFLFSPILITIIFLLSLLFSSFNAAMLWGESMGMISIMKKEDIWIFTILNIGLYS